MSALIVQGKIIGITENEVKPRPGSSKSFDPFKVIHYYVMNGGNSAPLRVTGAGEVQKYKLEESVKIPVWVKVRVDEQTKKAFTEIKEIRG